MFKKKLRWKISRSNLLCWIFYVYWLFLDLRKTFLTWNTCMSGIKKFVGHLFFDVNFSNIFIFVDNFNRCEEVRLQIASYSTKVTLKVLTPPNRGGWVNFFENKFFKDTYGLDFFFLNQTMRLSGCLDKKIKAIGLLENFLDIFEKNLKIFEFSKKNRKKLFLIFFSIFLFFRIVFGIENVLQGQGFPTHVGSRS